MVESSENLLWDLRLRLKDSQRHHRVLSEALRRKHFYLGVAVILLASTVTVGTLANISATFYVWSMVLSFTAAILAGLQLLLHFAERGENHRVKAYLCSALARKIEVMLVLTNEGQHLTQTELDFILREYEKISLTAPAKKQKLSSRVRESIEAGKQDR